MSLELSLNLTFLIFNNQLSATVRQKGGFYKYKYTLEIVTRLLMHALVFALLDEQLSLCSQHTLDFGHSNNALIVFIKGKPFRSSQHSINNYLKSVTASVQLYQEIDWTYEAEAFQSTKQWTIPYICHADLFSTEHIDRSENVMLIVCYLPFISMEHTTFFSCYRLTPT